MEKYLRLLIAIVLVLAIALLARNNIAWAGPSVEQDPAADAGGQASPALDKKDPGGSVKPPHPEITICEDRVEPYSVGGVSTLTVNDLEPGYCIVAFLRKHAFAIGRIPDGAGDILAPITFLRVFHHGKLVPELPAEDGTVEICYAIPPGRDAEIYFLDFYGPHFKERTGQPAWEPLETTVDGAMACAAAQSTGAYAIIGQ